MNSLNHWGTRKMININYKIIRDEGNETVVYEPNRLPKLYSNLVYIKAPNSTGKSTLLNLIALGFYGNKLGDSEIEKSLQRKIDNLLDIEHQKVIFDIVVNNPKIGWVLSSEKKNPTSTDISVKLKKNGEEKQLSSETFFDHFRLIYDIPYDPLERLPQLLQEVKNTQNDIGHKIHQFRDRLRNLIGEVRNSRDPKLLEELNDALSDLMSIKKKTDLRVKIYKNSVSKIQEYFLSRFYLETLREIKQQKNRLEVLENELEKAQKKGRKSARKTTNLDNKIADKKHKTIDLYNQLHLLLSQMLPKEEDDHLRLWRETNINDEIYKSDLYHNIRDKNKFFINVFSQALHNEQLAFREDLEKIAFYKDLLSTLSDIRYQNFELPGIDQTVQGFKKLINSELINYEELEQRIQNINNVISSINEFDDSLKSTINLVMKFEELTKNDSPTLGRDIESINDNVWSTKSLIKKLDEKASRIRSSLIDNHLDPTKTHIRYEKLKDDEDVSHFNLMNEEKIRNELKKAKTNLQVSQSQLRRINELIDVKEEKIEKMAMKKPHEYRKYINRLNELFDIATRLQQRFVIQYSNWIDDVIDGKELDANEKQFALYLGEFLASKINTIKHIDDEYKVVNIDLMNKTIITEERKEIRFDDIGTGQSQAAFLQGKLAIKDERKIIALLDEVAMMDEMTLEPIKKRLTSLYEQKKLFMAIIVQKSEKVDIEELL